MLDVDRHNFPAPVLSTLALLVGLTQCPVASAVEVDCFAAGNLSAAYVAVEEVTLRSAPNESATKVAVFTLGSRTCALISEERGRERWVFVRGYQFRRGVVGQLEGWIPLNAIAYKHELKLQPSVLSQKVPVEIGDYYAVYEIRKGGAYAVAQVVGEHRCKKGETPNEYGACEDAALVRGHILGQGVFAIAFSKKYGEGDVFKLKPDGRLCPWQYGSPPAACR